MSEAWGFQHVASKQICLLLCSLWLAPCTLLWALPRFILQSSVCHQPPSFLPCSPGSEAHRCLCNTLSSSALMWLCLLGEVLQKVSPSSALIWLYLLSEVSQKPYPPPTPRPDFCFPPTYLFFPILGSYPLACQQVYGFFLMVIILVSHSGPLHGCLLALLASGPPSLLHAHNRGLKRRFLVLSQGCLLVMSYAPSKVQCEMFFLWSLLSPLIL